MADKKSFVMYESWGAAIEKMNNEQAGELIKAIYAFQKNPDVVPEDPAIAFVFEIIKQKLEEDYKKITSPTRMQYARYRNGLSDVFTNSYGKAKAYLQRVLQVFPSMEAGNTLEKIKKMELELK